jgi:DNA-directed RNA polymerase specialized sigma24 family protein
MDYEDLAAEAIERFVGSYQQGRIDNDSNPAGYLRRIGANLVIDRLRRKSVPTESIAMLTHDLPSSLRGNPEAITENHLVLVSAFRHLRNIGDPQAERVLAAILDIAGQGGNPGVREVADWAGLTRSTTHRAWRRAIDALRSAVDEQQSVASTAQPTTPGGK